MRLSTRSAPTVLPGVRGTLRAERPTRALLGRLKPGDIAVIDHVDLDRATAQAMVEAGIVAVINAQPMISGRFPNSGPQVLADAGVLMVDSVGEFGFDCLADGRKARIHEGRVYDGEQRLTEGRPLDGDAVAHELEAARSGLISQLETFTHNSTELLRREQEILLHGEGLPALRTRLAGRPVVVVAGPADLRRLKAFVKEQHATVVAVGETADEVAKAGLRVDVLLLGDVLADGKVLDAAKDVVLVASPREVEEGAARAGASTQRIETTLSPDDVALLVAYAGHASVLVHAGASASLTDYLERRRPGLASSFLTRLAVGPVLVDAAALGTLYSGKVKGWQVMLALLVCVLVVAAALATTDVGQQWVHDVGHHVADQVRDLHARAQGRHP